MRYVLTLLILVISIFVVVNITANLINKSQKTDNSAGEEEVIIKPQMFTNPLSIESIKQKKIEGSGIAIEEELAAGNGYKRYIASYKSDGFKIYGLLTVPAATPPKEGFPAIVFAHGYIPPEQYRTTERYVAYVDSLAREGYVVFKIDYRGHGDSEGSPEGAYFSPAYTVDTINAAASLKRLPYVNPDKIGAWGHSMAGMIITRILVAKPEIFKSVVMWGGVVGSYEDIMEEWWSKRRPGPTFAPSQREANSNRPSRQLFIKQYGEPNDNNSFWNSISPKAYISNVVAPIALHHGEQDETVPVALSRRFAEELLKNKKTVELFTYPGGDHDISSPSFETAMSRTINFFDKYLK